jgi:integrase
MKVVERVRYGDQQGDGSLIRYEGVATWYSVYCQRGKEHRRSTHETDLKRARKVHKSYLDKLTVEREGGKPLATPQDAKITVAMLLDDLERADRLRGVNDKVKYHMMPVREMLGPIRAVSLTSAAVDRYIEAQKAAGYANASINFQVGSLKRALQRAHRDGTIPSVIYVQKLPVNNTRQGYFERPEFDAILPHLAADLQPVVEFCYLTGWRIGEVRGLRWSQVDFKAGTVRLEPGTTKNRDGRTFPFSALPALGDLLRRQREHTTTIEKQTSTIIPQVFHRNGKRITTFYRAWVNACAAANLPGKLVHDFRLTAVRNLERAGVPRSVAMKLTGHKTEAVYRRYAIVSEADLSVGVAKLAQLHAADRTPAVVVPLRSATSTA